MEGKQKISLSDESVKRVRELCDQVRKQSSKNELSIKMASGIADFAEKNGYISPKQAKWISWNARYHKLKYPTELQGCDPDSDTQESARVVDLYERGNGVKELRDILSALEQRLSENG